MDESSVVLSFKDTQINQEGDCVLSDVNIEVHKGEFVYLVGRTGSGKSSLLKTIYADLPLAKGNVVVSGHKIKNIEQKEVPFLRRKLGIVFQDFELLKDRNVQDNLFFVMRATGWKNTSKMKQRMNEVLLRVGLSSYEKKMPHQLSGGEQQRIVIARALLNDPSILLADEPTGNLDPEVSEGIMKLFEEINNAGTSILMATHDYRLIERHPHRVLKCEKGEVLDSLKSKFELRSDIL